MTSNDYRTIGVVTGSRADYGLLAKLIRLIHQDAHLTLKLFVTGSHLSRQHGYTIEEIEQDHIPIEQMIDLAIEGDQAKDIVRAIGMGCLAFADIFSQVSIDILLVLGDRYELLASVQAALIYQIPVAHIHGGELTQAVIDDAIRHSISKMSYWHFVCAEQYGKRLQCMGEAPDRIFNVGALSVDSVLETNFLDREQLSLLLRINWQPINFLITLHSETCHLEKLDAQIDSVLSALDYFPQVGLIFTQSNADSGYAKIQQKISVYVKARKNAWLFHSLGHLGYLSCVQQVDVIIGNSSSGVMEVPLLNKISVNIGDRQRGRFIPDSVIQTIFSRESIIAAINQGLTLSLSHQNLPVQLPFGKGKTAEKILKQLKEGILPKRLDKIFYEGA